MSTSNHERLLQLAKEAVRALIADESVNLETMEESLDELETIIGDEQERIELELVDED